MRKEMSLIAAHAAWHMGEWEEMAVYVDTVDSGPGGSNSPAHIAAAASLALQQQQQQQQLMLRSPSLTALTGAAAANGSSRGSNRVFKLVGDASAAAAAAAAAGGGGSGGAASSTGAFLRAVLCIKHDQHDLAQVNIERSRGGWGVPWGWGGGDSMMCRAAAGARIGCSSWWGCGGCCGCCGWRRRRGEQRLGVVAGVDVHEAYVLPPAATPLLKQQTSNSLLGSTPTHTLCCVVCPLAELLSTDLAALVGESYERAYTDMVRVQQLTELEEVVAYKEALNRWVWGE